MTGGSSAREDLTEGADTGKRVLLVSADPASNLDEVLGIKLSSMPATHLDELVGHAAGIVLEPWSDRSSPRDDRSTPTHTLREDVTRAQAVR